MRRRGSRLACLLAGAASASAAAAGPFKWSQQAGGSAPGSWLPARQTAELLAYQPLLGAIPHPMATPPPAVDEPRLLQARASTDNTCAYISGNADSSLYCSANSACVYNSANSHIGCCPDTSSKCPIYTTCYDSTQSSLASGTDGFTLLCNDPTYQHCIKHIFADDVFFGYTLLGCGRTAGSDQVFYNPTTTSSLSSTSRDRITRPSSSSSSTVGPTTTTALPVAPTTSAADSSSSSTPVGAIVGGVVGGVAALGLIGLGAFYLLRGRGPAQPPPPAAAPSPPGGGGGGGAGGAGPHPYSMYGADMAQTYTPPPQGGVAGPFVDNNDNRASVAKPYGATASLLHNTGAVSPPLSPPMAQDLAYMQHAYNNNAAAAGEVPPQQQQEHYSGHYAGPYADPYGQHGAGHQSGPVPETYAELPAHRGDGELRELAG